MKSFFILYFLISSFVLTAEEEVLFRINKLVNGRTYHWGIMNETGKIIIPPKFEGLGEFTNGVALAQSNKKWGVINKTGKFILKPDFQDVREFENELAWVIQKCPAGWR
jgi:hypothetical protein